MSFSVILQGILVVILALLPALIWLRLVKGKKQSKQAKKYMLIAFILGSLSVFLVLLVNYVWELFPQINVLGYIFESELVIEEKLIALFITLAIVEEIAKFLVVLFIDKAKNLINSIHDAIRYSIVAALGFAFAENIFYFYNFGLTIALYQFLALFAFRSIITVCGHLTFSGIFGNFYGISKFSKSFAVQEYWGNIKKLDKRALTDEEIKKKSSRFRKITLSKGLFFAALLHACFNFFLEMGMISYVLWLIFIGFAFLIYLYKRRSGYLSLVYRRSKFLHMHDRDKDVVLELLGLWYKEGKYSQVISTCERLLERDPNNPLIQLFHHKAKDNKRIIDAYTAIRNLFVRNHDTTNLHHSKQ